MKLFNKVATTLGVLLFSIQAFAEGSGAHFELGAVTDASFLGLLGLGAGLGVGLAAFGAASGQGKAAAAASKSANIKGTISVVFGFLKSTSSSV